MAEQLRALRAWNGMGHALELLRGDHTQIAVVAFMPLGSIGQNSFCHIYCTEAMVPELERLGLIRLPDHEVKEFPVFWNSGGPNNLPSEIKVV